MSDATPYFLWDYDLTESDVRGVLHGENETERLWMAGRILEHARFEDVWKYLTISEVVTMFPKLRMRAWLKEAWKRTLNVWGHNV